ncbi:MAG: MTAP family purine nucleoside phosphorylase [Acidimicrobiales bacterium]
MATVPEVHGDRLGLLVGHSLIDLDLGRPARRVPVDVASPRGPATVTLLDLDDVVVCSRHGLDDFRPAHLVDHHANLAALVAAGCDRVLALGSVGSLRTDWPVGTVVVPDDVFAPWVTPSWFDDARGHRVPGFDARWRARVLEAWRAHDSSVVDGGVYAQTIGPRFETPAEVRFLATVADVVGMTLAAEAILAGELGLAHAAVCVVDNLANGVAANPLTEAEFRAGVAANERSVRQALAAVLPALGRP